MPPEDETDPTGTPTGGEVDPLQALQDKLNTVGKTEHAKGMTAGKRALLSQLGFASVEEATAQVTSWRDRAETDSDLQKRVEAAELQVGTLQGQLARNSVVQAATAALMAADVRADRGGPALELVMNRLAGHPETPNPEVVQETVATFKTEMPEMFKPPADPNANGTDPSIIPALGLPGVTGLHGTAGPPSGRSGTDPAKAGEDAFLARHGKKLQQVNATGT